jgi:acid phosphatase class B
VSFCELGNKVDVNRFDRIDFFTTRNTVQASLITQSLFTKFGFTKNNNFYIFLATNKCCVERKNSSTSKIHNEENIFYYMLTSLWHVADVVC